MRKITALFVIFALIFGIMGNMSSCSGEKLTLMVYASGSDNEESFMAVTKDIEEMLSSELDTDRVNLLLFTGGSRFWYRNIPSEPNSVYIMKTKDGKSSLKLVKSNKKNQSMGSASTLSDFLKYSYKSFPADRYGLIFLGRGNSVEGFGRDSLFKQDSLSVSELKDALSQSPFKGENKLDFTGFDSSMTASLEICAALRDSSKYLIASQEAGTLDGWDYSFLKSLGSSFEAGDLTEAIADGLKKQKADYSLSCVDLSAAQKTAKAADSLFSSMRDSLKTSLGDRVRERAGMKSFGFPCDGSEEYSLDLVDLKSLADSSKSFKKQSDALLSAIKEAVAVNKTNIKSACGLSVYYPLEGRETFNKYEKTDLIGTGYRGYIDDLMGTRLDDAVKLSDVESGADRLTLRLTDEQRNSLLKASVNIFALSEDGYYPILTKKELTPDQNGVITITADEKVPSIGGKNPVLLEQTSRSDGKTVYRSAESIVDKGEESFLSTVWFEKKDESDELKITRVEYSKDKFDTEEKVCQSGKKTLSGYTDLSCTLYSLAADNDKPMRDWEDTFVYCGALPRAGFDNFKMTPASELYDKSFAFQLELEDVNGRLFYTQPFKLVSADKPKSIKLKTEKGAMYFSVYKNYSVLKKYEGEDLTVKIPAKAGSLPVKSVSGDAFEELSDYKHKLDSLEFESAETELGSVSFNGLAKRIVLPDGLKRVPDGLFKNCDDVEEVILPETVESLGARSFSGMRDLKRLNLPKSVKEIGDGAFDETRTEGLKPAADGRFKLKDGLLLSKDSKKLYAVLSAGDSLTVPKGVEEIAPMVHNGFALEPLKELSLPSTLKKVGYSAFSYESLTELKIPDSVVEIGSNAFDSGETLGSVYLGKALTRIGGNCLKNSDYEKLAVSKDNTYFQSKDNRLYNKAGDRDLTVTLLTSSDKAALNEKIYEIYSQLSKSLDLSGYVGSEEKGDKLTHDGKSFFKKMTLEPELLSFKKSDKITLCGSKFDIYCPLKSLISKGMKPEKDFKDEPIKPADSDVVKLKIKNRTITANIRNYSRKPQRKSDCGINEFLMYSNDYDEKEDMPDFEYMKVKESSDLGDVLEKLGKPSEFSIDSDNTVELSYYGNRNGEENRNELKIKLGFNDGKSKITSFTLNTE